MEVWIIASIVSFFIKGLCGFANTLIFNSILSYGTNNINITPVELLLGFPSNMILTIKNRKKLDFKIFMPLSIMVILGSIPGAFFLKYVDAELIKMFFGFLVILLGIEMWFRDRASNSRFSKSNIVMIIIGILSGLLCGLFGVGALLVAYVSRVTDTSLEFKANISAVFIVENIFRIVIYSLMGIITIETTIQSLKLIPFMLFGLLLGVKCAGKIDDKYIKKFVIILLVVSGIVLVVQNNQLS